MTKMRTNHETFLSFTVVMVTCTIFISFRTWQSSNRCKTRRLEFDIQKKTWWAIRRRSISASTKAVDRFIWLNMSLVIHAWVTFRSMNGLPVLHLHLLPSRLRVVGDSISVSESYMNVNDWHEYSGNCQLSILFPQSRIVVSTWSVTKLSDK